MSIKRTIQFFFFAYTFALITGCHRPQKDIALLAKPLQRKTTDRNINIALKALSATDFRNHGLVIDIDDFKDNVVNIEVSGPAIITGTNVQGNKININGYPEGVKEADIQEKKQPKQQASEQFLPKKKKFTKKIREKKPLAKSCTPNVSPNNKKSEHQHDSSETPRKSSDKEVNDLLNSSKKTHPVEHQNLDNLVKDINSEPQQQPIGGDQEKQLEHQHDSSETPRKSSDKELSGLLNSSKKTHPLEYQHLDNLVNDIIKPYIKNNPRDQVTVKNTWQDNLSQQMHTYINTLDYEVCQDLVNVIADWMANLPPTIFDTKMEKKSLEYQLIRAIKIIKRQTKHTIDIPSNLQNILDKEANRIKSTYRLTKRESMKEV